MREFSTQNKLERVRAPRVEIAYDVETGGAIERKELPFVMGVMADLSGRSESPLAPLTDYRRKFIEIDWDNFSDVMKGMAPRLAYQVENKLNVGGREIGVELRFACLDDFSPESVANQVDPLKKLVEVRTDLCALLAKTDGNDGLADKLQDILHNSDLQQSIREGSVVASNTTASGKAGVNGNKEKQATTEAGAQEASVFDQILTQINIGKSEWDRDQSRRQISTLVDEAMQGKLRVSTDVEQTIDARIKDIDRALTDQLNAIMHAHDFQRLESAWRGLHYLVRQTESSSRIRIRVLNVSKGELLKDFERAVEFDQSALFRKVYEEEYGTFGGAPYGALIGDYEFGNQPQDVSLLEKISNVAAAAHAPFLAAASPTLLGLQSFTELPHPRDLAKILATPEHACWQSFRTSEDSRYVGLALPRILLRLPYGPATNPVEAFNFMEEVSGGNQEHYLWGNAAYALGSCLTNAFAKYSWCGAVRGVEGGGRVEGLPTHTFRADDGEIALKCFTEIAITDRREKELSDLGFIPLVHCKGTDYAAFFSMQSCQKQKKYDADVANANSRLAGQLQYVLTTSRFAHYIRAMTRDQICGSRSRGDWERFLNRWIGRYVMGSDEVDSAYKARSPLREARIDVAEVPGKPGVYKAVCFLRPHFQLDELSISLRLVVEMPPAARS